MGVLEELIKSTKVAKRIMETLAADESLRPDQITRHDSRDKASTKKSGVADTSRVDLKARPVRDGSVIVNPVAIFPKLTKSKNEPETIGQKLAKVMRTEEVNAKAVFTSSIANGAAADASRIAADRVSNLKLSLLRLYPFYAELLQHIEIIEDRRVETACTNGRELRYNPAFFNSLTEGQTNYVIMHEIMHVIFGHSFRRGLRDPKVWNIACDFVVNEAVDELLNDFQKHNIEISRPPQGLFSKVYGNMTADNVYALIVKDNDGDDPDGGGIGKIKTNPDGSVTLKIRKRGYFGINVYGEVPMCKVRLDEDLVEDSLSAEQKRIIEKQINQMIRGAARSASGNMGRSPFGSASVGAFIYRETAPLPVDWRKLLRDMLDTEASDDTSYATPEKKYIHMDLILPGHGTQESAPENLWVFIDSSGSIGENQLQQFLAQVVKVTRELNCYVNVAYWDTEVTDVYKRVNMRNISSCRPTHSGGTNVNCVYRYLQEQKIKPGAMIIMTDGAFGQVEQEIKKSLYKKTILLLTEPVAGHYYASEFRKIGKVTELNMKDV